MLSVGVHGVAELVTGLPQDGLESHALLGGSFILRFLPLTIPTSSRYVILSQLAFIMRSAGNFTGTLPTGAMQGSVIGGGLGEGYGRGASVIVRPKLLRMKSRDQGVDRDTLFSALTFTSHYPTRGREGESEKMTKIPNKSRRESISMVPRDGIEPPTRGFSVRCSTD